MIITLLHSACIKLNFTIVKYLIDRGCDVNILTKKKVSPLIFVAMQMYYNRNKTVDENHRALKIIELLIHKGSIMYNIDEHKHSFFSLIKGLELEKSIMEIVNKYYNLLNRCLRYIKNSREKYKDRLHMLNRDLRKLF